MSESTKDLFSFLENSPYFYNKESLIAETGGAKKKKVVYTFYSQENPYQSVGEIVIPLDNTEGDVDWKFIQLNENLKYPVFQTVNENLSFIPSWFKILILKVNDIFRRIKSTFEMFFQDFSMTNQKK